MKKRKPILYISSICSLTISLILMYGPTDMSLITVEMLIIVFGFFNAGLVNAYAISGEMFSKKIAGLSISFCNMISVLFGALTQVIVGYMLEYKWDGLIIDGKPVYQPEHFQFAMIWVPISLICAFIMAYFIRETNCLSWEERNDSI